MGFNDLTVVISIATNIAICLVVILQGTTKRLNRLFFFVVLSLIIWIFSLQLYLISYRSGSLFLLFGRLNFVSTSILGYWLVIFTNRFPEDIGLIKNKILRRSYLVITLLLIAITIATPWIDEKEEYLNGEYNTVYGVLYPLFIVHFAGSMLTGISILLINYFRYEGAKKIQLLIISIGIISSSIFTLVTNLFLPYLFGNFILQHYGPLGTTFFTISVTYAILKYQFLDVRVVLGRILYYLLIASLLFFGFFIIYFFDLVFFGSAESTGAIVSGVFNAVVFALIFVRLTDYLRTQVRSRIINPGYDPLEVTDTYSREIAKKLNIREILKLTDEVLIKTLRIDACIVDILPDQTNPDHIIVKSGAQKAIDIRNFQALSNIWEKTEKRAINVDELEIDIPEELIPHKVQVEKIADYMRSKKLKLLIPIKEGEETKGILILGQKQGDSPYSMQDVKFVEGMASALGLAVTRAIYYLEVEDLNKNLQRRVNEATKELSTKNTKLTLALAKIEEIRRQERDMIDVMGHELRTPITIVRNALLVLEKKIKNKEKITEAKLLDYIEKALESATRELDLVETLLSATKVESNRIQLSFTKIDAIDVVHDSIEGHKAIAKDKGLKLIFDKPKQKINAFADRNRTQEIVDNLLSNAVKYTLHGFVEIKLYTKDKKVYFQVKDSGIGIGQEDIKNLGKKFFRAKQYLNTQNGDGRAVVRPGGTGLGLYVSLNLARLMKGKIDIKSKVGQGSTFTLILPLYESQKDKQIDQTFAKEL